MKSLLTKLLMAMTVIIFVISLSGNAEGAVWKKFDCNKMFNWHYDTETINFHSKNIVQVWVKKVIYDDKALLDYIQDMSYLKDRGKANLYKDFSYELTLVELNFATKNCRFLRSADYTKDGKMIYYSIAPSKWGPFAPTAPIGKLYKILYAKR